MSASNNHRWFVVGITVLNQAVVTGIGFYCFAIFSIPWLEQFDISRGQLMLSVTALMIANGLLAPFVGHRLDRLPLLWPMTTGFLLFCTGLALLSIATAYWQVIVIYATFFAIGQMLAGTLASQILVNRWFVKDSGMALGISATGTSLGGILFPLLIAELILTASLSAVFQSLALMLAVALFPANYFILRLQPPARDSIEGSDVVENTAPPVVTWTTQTILKSRAFWVPISVMLPISASFVAIQANLGIHLKDLEFPVAFTGQMIAVISAMMVVGKLLYGALADRFEHAYLLLFMGAMSITAIALLMMTSAQLPLLTAAVLLGLASGGLLPVMGVVFAARFGLSMFGKVIGLVTMAMASGSLGSLYTAWIYDLFGSYHYAFISFIVMLLPGLILLKWLPPPLERPA